MHDHVGGRRERHGGHYDFVTRANAEGDQAQMKRSRSAAGGHGVGRAHVVTEPAFELMGSGACPDPETLEGRDDLLNILPLDVWPSENDETLVLHGSSGPDL